MKAEQIQEIIDQIGEVKDLDTEADQRMKDELDAEVDKKYKQKIQDSYHEGQIKKVEEEYDDDEFEEEKYKSSLKQDTIQTDKIDQIVI